MTYIRIYFGLISGCRDEAARHYRSHAIVSFFFIVSVSCIGILVRGLDGKKRDRSHDVHHWRWPAIGGCTRWHLYIYGIALYLPILYICMGTVRSIG